MKEKREEVIRVLPLSLRNVLRRLPMDYEKLQEIRLRIGCPVVLVYDNEERFISCDNNLCREPQEWYRVTASDIKESMDYISNYSMYAFEEELRQGFITIQGGHRIGIAGKTVIKGERVHNIRHISFINIRLSHQVMGCADSVIPYVLDNDKVYHSLIISPPKCGKTTLLRDLIRQLSNGGPGWAGKNIGVVDERSELGACYLGVPQNDLGIRTDVLDCCPKAEGMMMLIRSMSPEIVAVDEIGSKEDLEAIDYVMNCGCILLATVHGRDIDDIKQKPILGQMVREKRFNRYLVLSHQGGVGHLKEVFDERGTVLYTDGGAI